MQVLCEITQSTDERTRVAGLRCVAALVKAWRKDTVRYMAPAVNAIMLDAITSPSDTAAKTSMQFWSHWVVDTAASDTELLLPVIKFVAAKLSSMHIANGGDSQWSSMVGMHSNALVLEAMMAAWDLATKEKEKADLHSATPPTPSGGESGRGSAAGGGGGGGAAAAAAATGTSGAPSPIAAAVAAAAAEVASQSASAKRSNAGTSASYPPFDSVMFPIVGAGMRLLAVDHMFEHSIRLLATAATVYGCDLAPHADGYMSALLTWLQHLALKFADAPDSKQQQQQGDEQKKAGRKHSHLTDSQKQGFAFWCITEIAYALGPKFARYVGPWSDMVARFLAIPLADLGSFADGKKVSVEGSNAAADAAPPNISDSITLSVGIFRQKSKSMEMLQRFSLEILHFLGIVQVLKDPKTQKVEVAVAQATLKCVSAVFTKVATVLGYEGKPQEIVNPMLSAPSMLFTTSITPGKQCQMSFALQLAAILGTCWAAGCCYCYFHYAAAAAAAVIAMMLLLQLPAQCARMLR